MTLTIELTPIQEARLQEAAQKAGIGTGECARRFLDEKLSADKNEDPTTALLRKWREEDATDDPAEIAKAEQEWQEFREAMNAERRRVGARILYP